jgi:hypothetical protein
VSLAERTRITVVFVVWFVLLFSLGQQVVTTRGYSFDFYPSYVSGQAFWSGISPYSESVTRTIQEGYYAGAMPDGADEMRAAYPAYTFIMIAPLLPFPAETAIALWMALQGVAILAALCLWLPRIDLRAVLLLVGACIFYRYNVSTYLIAQFNGVVLFFASLGCWLLARQRNDATAQRRDSATTRQRNDAFAGLAFAFATMQPTLAAPLALLILGALALRGRWLGLMVFGGILSGLMIVTFLIVGWWIPDWILNLRDYSSYVDHLVWLPERVGLFIVPVSLILLLIGLWKMPDRWADQYVIVVCGLLFIVPQTGSYFLVLLLPVVLIASQRAAMMSVVRRWLTYSLIILFFAASWVYQPLDIETRKIEGLLMPLHALLIWLSAVIPFQMRTMVNSNLAETPKFT